MCENTVWILDEEFAKPLIAGVVGDMPPLDRLFGFGKVKGYGCGQVLFQIGLGFGFSG